MFFVLKGLILVAILFSLLFSLTFQAEGTPQGAVILALLAGLGGLAYFCVHRWHRGRVGSAANPPSRIVFWIGAALWTIGGLVFAFQVHVALQNFFLLPEDVRRVFGLGIQYSGLALALLLAFFGAGLMGANRVARS